MAKDKKKKKNKKSGQSGFVALKATETLRSLGQNPFVADVVAAALVATAAALKDADKARRLAASAGDELESLAKSSAKRGSAMWKLALDIGRQALDEIGGNAKAPKRARAPAKAKPKPKPKPVKKSGAGPAKKAKKPAASPRKRQSGSSSKR
jgi:hypothetical protein